MYLGTGDIIATIIATIIAPLGALTVMGLAIKDNARLVKEIKYLRQRVRQLNKQVEAHDLNNI